MLELFPITWLAWLVRYLLRGSEHSGRADIPRRGDVVLVVDSVWGYPRRLKYFKKLRRRGVQFASFSYDLIPMTHPHLTHNLELFEGAVRRLLDLSALVLCISEFTKTELTRLFPEALEKSETVWLGCDFAKHKALPTDQKGKRRPNSILVLGTVEPRKNYSFLLDWFESEGGAAFSMTVVGGAGWNTEELQQRMRRIQSDGDRFTWYPYASDRELRTLLLEHEFGVQASLVEGFGLPIWEMSHCGLILVLSDIPVFRELAPHGAVFFDPYSRTSFSNALKSAAIVHETAEVMNGGANREISVRSWDAFATDVAGALGRMIRT
tara:strand:- start:12671 stop:13639 length:969 start_codon:yes stop_codon:yes gene_type:complete